MTEIGDAFIRDFRDTIRDLHDRNRRLADADASVRAERDAAIARAEGAEVALADALDQLREALANLAEREPWRVLRAAADVIDALDRQPADTTPVLVDTSHGPNRWYALRAAADRLEREHAETANRDRLAVAAERAYNQAVRDVAKPDEVARVADPMGMAAAVTAVLAEAVDQ